VPELLQFYSCHKMHSNTKRFLSCAAASDTKLQGAPHVCKALQLLVRGVPVQLHLHHLRVPCGTTLLFTAQDLRCYALRQRAHTRLYGAAGQKRDVVSL